MDYSIFKERYEQNLERIKRLCLFDDDFMTKCFDGHPECVELLLHIILEKPDLRVLEMQVQTPIRNLQGRSIILDILAVDSNGKRYNIEVQQRDDGAKPKRARYHSSLMDANAVLAGDDTDGLPENYVVFITRNDVLKGGCPLYHIDRAIAELGISFGDEAHILYVNGSYRGDSPIGHLMSDFASTDPDGMYYSQLQNRVRHFKQDKEGIEEMCKVWEEVHNEGRQEGEVTKALSIAKIMLANGESDEKIIRYTGLSLEDVGKLKS